MKNKVKPSEVLSKTIENLLNGEHPTDQLLSDLLRLGAQRILQETAEAEVDAVRTYLTSSLPHCLVFKEPGAASRAALASTCSTDKNTPAHQGFERVFWQATAGEAPLDLEAPCPRRGVLEGDLVVDDVAAAFPGHAAVRVHDP